MNDQPEFFRHPGWEKQTCLKMLLKNVNLLFFLALERGGVLWKGNGQDWECSIVSLCYICMIMFFDYYMYISMCIDVISVDRIFMPPYIVCISSMSHAPPAHPRQADASAVLAISEVRCRYIGKWWVCAILVSHACYPFCDMKIALLTRICFYIEVYRVSNHVLERI